MNTASRAVLSSVLRLIGMGNERAHRFRARQQNRWAAGSQRELWEFSRSWCDAGCTGG